ncbi:hypothetical protein ACFFGH_06390 [Lysobacter korlensis]|uniref:Tetratricopeptide repeat protein n=1 Tax=Lysobacter korlensis TaxID=553636 RepID=A0ABV6RKG1_9GAMM
MPATSGVSHLGKVLCTIAVIAVALHADWDAGITFSVTTKAAPQDRFNELLDRGLLALSNGISPFELKCFERDAERLKKTDAGLAFELLALAAAIGGRLDEADTLFEKALPHSRQTVFTVQRYMIVLAGTAQTEKMLSLFRRFESVLRNSPAAIDNMSRALTTAGWLFTAEAFRGEAERMGIDIPSIVGSASLAKLDRTEFPEEKIAEAVGFSHRYLRERGASPEAVEACIVPSEDGTSAVFFQFALERPADEVVDLEWDLFGELSKQQFAIQRSGRLVFGLTSLTA